MHFLVFTVLSALLIDAGAYNIAELSLHNVGMTEYEAEINHCKS